jgi:hypothetical protein
MPVAQDGQYVVVRVPVVDDDRQTKLRCQIELRLQDAPLRITRREVTVIIQPNLAYRHDLGRRGQSFQFFKHIRIKRLGVVRMNPDSSVNTFVLLRQLDRRAARWQINAWIDDARDIALCCPGNDRLAIGVESPGIQVAVRIRQVNQ